MNELVKYLVNSVLNESIQRVIAVYAGRFQPFHAGHYGNYMHLVKKFGKNNVYIASSDVTDNVKSPFSFREKKAIMTKMFGVPSDKIVQINNPYAPIEILNRFDPATTAFVTAVGEKDSGRLSGKYFKPYNSDTKKMEGYKDKGYVYAVPMQAGGLSGTETRKMLSTGSTEQKKKAFQKIYPKFDEQIFKLITLKLSKGLRESVITIGNTTGAKTIDEMLNEIVSIYPNVITEGGAYGHMAHPFDIDMNLTFGDLKQIVKNALTGKLQLTTEKLDGQAIAVSWVNGRLVAARNKSHLKNSGKDAMDFQSLVSKFAGRGTVSDAFSSAMKDLESAIKGLSDAQKKKIFKNGKCFMNCEIIYPANTNVIPYGHSTLLFHGTMEYNDEGTAIGQNKESASILAGMIKQINADVQKTFTIQGPAVAKLPKNEDLKSKQGVYLAKIANLQSEFGLSDRDGVADYHQAFWKNYIEKKAPKGLDEQEKIGLVKRWAFGDKSFTIKSISNPKIKEWADKTDKENLAKITKDNIAKFENIFLGVGAEVLSFMSSALVANPDKAKQALVGRLESTISAIRATNNSSSITKLETELTRLQDLGGFDKIVPIEGIAFSYKGGTYKLTGAFAPLNQILGIFTYSR
jgi:hypothetical protein